MNLSEILASKSIFLSCGDSQHGTEFIFTHSFLGSEFLGKVTEVSSGKTTCLIVVPPNPVILPREEMEIPRSSGISQFTQLIDACE